MSESEPQDPTKTQKLEAPDLPDAEREAETGVRPTERRPRAEFSQEDLFFKRFEEEEASAKRELWEAVKRVRALGLMLHAEGRFLAHSKAIEIVNEVNSPESFASLCITVNNAFSHRDLTTQERNEMNAEIGELRTDHAEQRLEESPREAHTRRAEALTTLMSKWAEVIQRKREREERRTILKSKIPKEEKHVEERTTGVRTWFRRTLQRLGAGR